MTTPPKVRIYRRKRGESAPDEQDTAAEQSADEELPEPADDGDLQARIEAVKAEGLTSRQLRLARRIAAMHGVPVESDEEAVIRLRERGVDPFHRSSLGSAMGNADAQAQQGSGIKELALRKGPQLPGSATPLGRIAKGQIPADQISPHEKLNEEKRAAEIIRIQRDIARRRRSRQFWLAVRLLLLVGLPTFIAGWYYFTVATPLYETKSQFLIQQADAASTEMGTSILSGIQLNPDSVSVQSYLTSKNAMLRLDEEIGFKEAFQDPSIDPLLRLPPDATEDDAFKTYADMVKVGYDPTEGVLNMDVVAPDPELSERFSRALLGYAEGMVDEMTARVRNDQMSGAQAGYEAAEKKLRDAQIEVQKLQEQVGMLDAESESSLVMSQVGQLQSQLIDKQLELSQLLSNANPNASRVSGVRGDIKRLQELIAETRADLTESGEDHSSLAQIGGQLAIAQADLEIRQQLLFTAAEQLERARGEANKQVRYLSLSVSPVAPQEASYPKAVLNTIVAFLIFMGIYLMMSLTASILREQVST
ncbi:capsule biosynthesis protein [Paracoccus sp. SCSIO 75233]|uniref:capsule biosynthesis protein n=1 Tax=Paracoccus sp. SCSIO 75233 TaxID=3017782 RepID=UPI0022F077CC|nr:capsule biosynthesis protein [Paracoccus sp. SCSIO 75233]WBU51808.1 capsule biosynthesis protein [Paracoccus sp. SCSIO 75233]